jgi:type VI secretion system secreted protein VgrG
MSSFDAIHVTMTSPLEAPADVRRVSAYEALNEPYRASVVMDVADPDASAEALLGQDVVLAWGRPGRERRLTGLVLAVRKEETVQDRARFRLEVVPALRLLAMRRNTRMFQEKKVPEILEAVLGEALGPYGRSVTLELAAEYPKREYCLQYQESDLDFVHRLMEEEGIAYCFDHEGDQELLLLRDANDAHPRAAGAEEPVPYEPHDLALSSAEPIHRFRREHWTTTTAVAMRDYDWTRPTSIVEGTAEGEDALGRVRESYEHGWARSATIWSYDQGARRYAEHDAARQKAVRQEGESAGKLVARGRGRVVSFEPGRTFELSGHRTGDGEYLLTSVQHTFDTERGSEAGVGYQNEFECIPLDVEYRPRRGTAKPRVPSIQTAIVTGPSGEEIHTDEHGRVKVQFHWDRENPANETSSCWVRVQQKWAGNGWGFWWLPRIGMEVVVQFVDGDPDRPLVTGSVYDGNNAPPYPLPDEKTKSTIKSNSSPGGGGSNELRFEDKAGSEEIYTHAQKDFNEVVENDHSTLVHHDQRNTVDNDQTQTVHNNQTEEVRANQTMTVDGNRTVHVEGNYDETVDGTETRTVTGDVSETFSANETRSVGADLTEDVAASETRTIGGSQTETISASHTLNVAAASDTTISGALSETVVGGVTIDTPASWTVDVTGALNIVAPAGIKLDAAGGWKISAAGGVTQIDAGKDWTGFFWRAKGAFSRGITGVKLERFGASFTYVHSKVGFTGASMPQLGVKLEFNTTCVGTIGAKLSAGGADVRSWGVEMDN